jgi:hypothetical protein
MAPPKAKPKAAPKPAAKSAALPKVAPAAKMGSVAAGGIKPAAVIVPAVSVVAPATVLAPAPVLAPALAASPAMSGSKPEDDATQPAMLKKQELVERVVKATGGKKKDVKLMLEAALGVLGDALSAGEELNLPPLGKVKVNRQKTEGGAEVLILKLRRGGGKVGNGNPKEGVAQDLEDD